MADKTKKPNKIVSFFSGVKKQWQKIEWTDKPRLKRQMATVIVISIVLVAIILCVDFNVLHLVQKIV